VARHLPSHIIINDNTAHGRAAVVSRLARRFAIPTLLADRTRPGIKQMLVLFETKTGITGVTWPSMRQVYQVPAGNLLT